VLKQKNRISLGIKSIITTSVLNLSKEILGLAKKKHEMLKVKEAAQKQALTKKKYTFFRWFH
jgi:hypothetical protein